MRRREERRRVFESWNRSGFSGDNAEKVWSETVGITPVDRVTQGALPDERVLSPFRIALRSASVVPENQQHGEQAEAYRGRGKSYFHCPRKWGDRCEMVWRDAGSRLAYQFSSPCWPRSSQPAGAGHDPQLEADLTSGYFVP